MASKSVKLFNLEERKNLTGTAITEVDIFQWKNTLIDNLKRDTEFQDLCTETARWDFENVTNRGFQDTVDGDGSALRKASRVHSMLTKIASYAPKSIVREITRRTRSLTDIWNIARDWAVGRVIHIKSHQINFSPHFFYVEFNSKQLLFS